MFKKCIFLILFILLSLNVVAVKEQINQIILDRGLILEYPKIDILQTSKNITFNFHVYNSTGKVQTNITTTCGIHIYNSIGDHILRSNLIYNDYDFYIVLNKTLLTREGYYTYIAWCENAQEGGFVSAEIILTKDGLPPTEPNLLSLVIAQTIFILFYMFAGIVNFADGKKDTNSFSFWIGFVAIAMAIAQMMLLMAYVHGSFNFITTKGFQDINISINFIMLFGLSMLTYTRLSFLKMNFADDEEKW